MKCNKKKFDKIRDHREGRKLISNKCHNIGKCQIVRLIKWKTKKLGNDGMKKFQKKKIRNIKMPPFWYLALAPPPPHFACSPHPPSFFSV